ncbi:MAG: prohibitin family protein [bacterium]|nr:prohibitin family protein [bacterium]
MRRLIFFLPFTVLFITGCGAIFPLAAPPTLTIQPDEVGVLFNSFNGDVAVLGAGTYSVQRDTSITVYPLSQQEFVMANIPAQDDSVDTRTLDGQALLVDISVVYRIDSDRVTDLYTRWYDRYQEDFIRPTLRSAVREVVSRYTAEDLYADDGQNLSVELQNVLETAFSSEGLILENVTVSNLTFSGPFAEAIERRTQAETEVYNAQQTSEAIRLTAQADADAARATAEALQRTPTPRP